MKLSDDSKRIVQFIKKTKLRVIKRNINMKEIYDDIKEAHDYVTNTDLYINKSVEKITNVLHSPSSETIKSIGDYLIPDSIRNKIIDSLLYTVTYTFDMFGRTFTVVFNVCDIIDLDKTDSMIEAVFRWLYIVNLYSPPKCSRKVDIYIFLCDIKKRMPKETIDVIGEKHVNSAYTYCCPTNNQIIIYRKEEWFKVFIHETMHSFGLDFCGSGSRNIVDSNIKPIFDITSDMNIYEAYCETWAVIMNSAFGAFGGFEKNKEIVKGYTKFGDRFREIMSDEIVFSAFQMEKILHHMGLSYTDLYSENSASVIKRYLYKEESEVFSYFVVKNILLYNYNRFIVWCKNTNDSLINFKSTDKGISEFCRFILDHHKTPSLMKHVSDVRKIDIGKRDKKLILDTARMTSHGYEF